MNYFSNFCWQFNAQDSQYVEGDGLLGTSIESEIGLEFIAPLFSFRWNFSPSNPDSLFVLDNIFELSWEIEY